MTQDELHMELARRFADFKRSLELLKETNADLEKSPAEGKWNARECFEHLVVMWQQYRPQFERAFEKASHRTGNDFKSGKFGGWFANRMKPIESGGMRTAHIFEPHHYKASTAALDRLIEVQDEMINYLKKMQKVDLMKSKVASPASKLVRLRMGDAFIVLANHQDRHWQQALRAMNKSS